MTDGETGRNRRDLGWLIVFVNSRGLFLCDGVAPQFTLEIFLILSDCMERNMSDPVKDAARHKHVSFLTLSLTIKAPSFKSDLIYLSAVNQSDVVLSHWLKEVEIQQTVSGLRSTPIFTPPSLWKQLRRSVSPVTWDLKWPWPWWCRLNVVHSYSNFPWDYRPVLQASCVVHLW